MNPANAIVKMVTLVHLAWSRLILITLTTNPVIHRVRKLASVAGQMEKQINKQKTIRPSTVPNTTRKKKQQSLPKLYTLSYKVMRTVEYNFYKMINPISLEY
jgi:hypothetical protein